MKWIMYRKIYYTLAYSSWPLYNQLSTGNFTQSYQTKLALKPVYQASKLPFCGRKWAEKCVENEKADATASLEVSTSI